jgi:hypothetical protein
VHPALGTGKGIPMEIHQDSTKKFSTREKYSIDDLKSHYDRAKNKPTREQDLSDPSGLAAIVYVDEKDGLHFRYSNRDWVAMKGLKELEQSLAKILITFLCAPLEVHLVVDPKSKPETALKVIQLVQSGAPQKQLTLSVGRRVSKNENEKQVKPIEKGEKGKL